MGKLFWIALIVLAWALFLNYWTASAASSRSEVGRFGVTCISRSDYVNCYRFDTTTGGSVKRIFPDPD